MLSYALCDRSIKKYRMTNERQSTLQAEKYTHVFELSYKMIFFKIGEYTLKILVQKK